MKNITQPYSSLNLLDKLRSWLIVKLAGKTTVVINSRISIENRNDHLGAKLALTNNNKIIFVKNIIFEDQDNLVNFGTVHHEHTGEE